MLSIPLSPLYVALTPTTFSARSNLDTKDYTLPLINYTCWLKNNSWNSSTSKIVSAGIINFGSIKLLKSE